MNKSSVVHARMEPATKKRAEGVLRRLGLTPTEAIRIFYTQICLRKALPFRVHVPNETTARTLDNSRAGRDVQPCSDKVVDDLEARLRAEAARKRKSTRRLRRNPRRK